MTLLLLVFTLLVGGHTFDVRVCDRQTNKPLSAQVFLGDRQAQTADDGVATFRDVPPGTHRLAIIADDPQYLIVNDTVQIPKLQAVIVRLSKVQRPQR